MLELSTLWSSTSPNADGSLGVPDEERKNHQLPTAARGT